jgi:hypothetical protein
MRSQITRSLLATIALACGVLAISVSPAAASGGTENNSKDARAVFVAGNATKCDGDLPSLKVDPARSGTFTSSDGALTATATLSQDGTKFSWSSTGMTVDKVQVKGGSDTYVYPSSVKNDLRSPPMSNGNIPAVSHIVFCYQPPQPVKPVLECVWKQTDGTYLALWGSDNPNQFTRLAPLGSKNAFTPAPADRGQPTSFAKGRSYGTFVTSFDGANLTWTLEGSAVTASKNSPKCSDVPVPVVGSAGGSILFFALLGGLGVVGLAFGLRRQR